jgi:hypothetical protein
MVHTGDKLRISASTWNAVLSMLEWFRGSRLERMAERLEQVYQPSLVFVKNTTSSDLDRGDVLGIDTPLVSVTDNADWFKESLDFIGSAPSTSTPHYGQYAILREACPAGEIARAVISGVALAKLTITHASDQYCEITNNVTSALTTGALGTSRILWKESGTGSGKWGLIRVGNESREILVYNATGSAIGAAASGTATVYTGTPGSEASSGQTLTVYNRTSVSWANAKYGWAHAYRGNAYVVPIQT